MGDSLEKKINEEGVLSKWGDDLKPTAINEALGMQSDEDLFEFGDYKFRALLVQKCGGDKLLASEMLKFYHQWIALAEAFIENYPTYKAVENQSLDGLRIRDTVKVGVGLLALISLTFLLFEPVVFQISIFASILLFAKLATAEAMDSRRVAEIVRRHHDLGLELRKLNSSIQPEKLAIDYIYGNDKNALYKTAGHLAKLQFSIPD